MRRDTITAWGTIALTLGIAGLIPGLALVLFPPAAVLGLTACILAWRRPEKYAGRKRAVFSLILAGLGLALFIIEARAFLFWKVEQETVQRYTITEGRMERISLGLEEYRERNGEFPEVGSVVDLCERLVPDYLEECRPLDAWGRDIQILCRPGEYRIWTQPLEGEEVPPEMGRRIAATGHQPRGTAVPAVIDPSGGDPPSRETSPDGGTPEDTGHNGASRSERPESPSE
jgi:hypothetical protein